MKFPKDFYWGASTSAHQIEGGLENSWSEWEKKNSKISSEKYRQGPPHWYEMSEENLRDACDPDNYISGKGCDSFHRYREDVEVLKELGLNAYRFSVDWSRIEPKKGEYSEEGIEYYRSLVKELKSNGIEPFLTCWHWPVPLWLREEGGLEARNIVEYFRNYVEFLVENLGSDVKYWMSVNEPVGVAAASYLAGMWPPQKKNIFIYFKVAYSILVNMHKEAYLVIKEFDENLQVSVAKNNSYTESYNDFFLNRFVAGVYRYFASFLYLDRVKDYLDFVGLNYYFHNKMGVRGIRNDNDRVNDMGWWMDPKGIYYTLKEIKDRYDLPVFITENGLADREDKYRAWWLDETVGAMREALEYGVDLRGYMHWSLLDNFEWAEGFWPRFGLATKDREIKKSGWYYRDLVRKLS
jgi:beta-glucosidase